MPRPADPELIAEAVRMVEAGATYSSAGRAVGLSWMTVRTWCLRQGVESPESKPERRTERYTALTREMRAWESSRLPDDLDASENGSESRRRRSGGRPALYVGFTGKDDLPRPDLVEGAVINPDGLQTAMTAWRQRISTATATDVIERCLRSTWDADVRHKSA